jgi:Flp pilus assembly protein TadB
MTNETPKDRMQDIWLCQPVEGIKMSVEEIRGRAGKFEKKIMWRNVREYGAGAIAAILLGFSFASTHNLLDRAAFALLIIGMAYALHQLHRKGQSRSMPDQMGTASSLEFYRGELERQRELVSNVWPWYLGPFVPGLVLSAIASVTRNPQPLHIAALALWYGLIAVFFIFVWRLNVRAARCLQRMIDDLRRAEQS